MRLDISLHSPQSPPNPQPVPQYPPLIKRFGSDWEVDDPRHGDPGFYPRVFGEKDTIPEAFKYGNGNPLEMDLPRATLWRDSLGLYAPQSWKTQPPNWDDGNNWDWITEKSLVKTRLDQMYLHLIHGARFGTNKTGPNDPGYLDPVTGVGTLGQAGTLKPYHKEQVTTGGNYVWDAGGGKMWCIDGLAPAPTAEQLRDKFYLLHVCTQSSPVMWDATKRPEIDCPNGIWRRPDFPQAGGNIVVHPIFSTWANGLTMEWNGLHLRQDVMPAVRVKSWPPPAILTWPYIPNKPLIETW